MMDSMKVTIFRILRQFKPVQRYKNFAKLTRNIYKKAKNMSFFHFFSLFSRARLRIWIFFCNFARHFGLLCKKATLHRKRT